MAKNDTFHCSVITPERAFLLKGSIEQVIADARGSRDEG